MSLQDDRSLVHAGPRRDRHPALSRELAKVGVVGERIAKRVDGMLEQQQKAIGLVDLAAAVRLEQRPRQARVLRHELAGPLVAELLDEARAVDQVGQQQRADITTRVVPRYHGRTS